MLWEGLDPAFRRAVEALAEAMGPNPPPLASIPPAVVRDLYRAQRIAQNAATSPASVAARGLEVGGADGWLPARLYTPHGAGAPGPLLVYFHGGGWVIGDLETHDGHCRRLAEASGARVLAVDYRLAPEHPFPAAHDDALSATRWAFDHAEAIGADPARIGVGGCSAGGNLAASVALTLRNDPERRLKLQVLLYPVTWPAKPTASRRAIDGPVLTFEAMAWFEKHLAAAGRPGSERAQPARAADLAGLPPTLIVIAGFDLLHDEGRDYGDRLRAAGIACTVLDHPSLPHDFYTMGDVSPLVPAAAREVGEAIRQAL